MSVMPCDSVPAELGDFDLDQRVNYAFGMVMGVDDFRQEQAYHVGRKRLNNRALHGYGVASGLDVTLRDPGADVKLVVAPGIAVLPGGEDVQVDREYCLPLKDWLADRPAEELEAARRGAGGPWRFCVTLGYAECLERLVPVPGLPCASETESRQYSRIREAFGLALEPAPVPWTAEWATRRLGAVLDRIEIDDTPGGASDEDEIVALVRAIGTDASPLVRGTVAEPPAIPTDDDVLRLPAEGAAEALRRVYRTWVSEVRPFLLDRMVRNPRIETLARREDRIVLACLELDPDGDDRPDAATAVVDPTLRPVLVDTRALQELLLAGTRRRRRDMARFATLQDEDPDRLRVWVHHPEPLNVPDVGSLRVWAEEAPVAVLRVTQRGANDFDLMLEREVPADARVRVAFDASELRTEADVPLLESMEDLALDYVSRRGTTLFAETVFRTVAASRRFLTVRYANPRALEMWFHTDEPLGFHEDEAGEFTLERDGRRVDPAHVVLEPAGADRRDRRWRLRLLPGPEPDFSDGELLRLRFDVEPIFHAETGGARLGPWIRRTETAFLGWDGEHHIDVFHHVFVEDPVLSRRTERFARLCVRGPTTLRMWLHAPGTLRLDGLTSEDGPLRLFVEAREVRRWVIRAVDASRNIFELEASDGSVFDADGTSILALFLLDRIPLDGGRTLGELLPRLDFTYLNLDKATVREDHLHCCCQVRTCHLGSLQAREHELLLWFHTDEAVSLRQVHVTRTGGERDLDEMLEVRPLTGNRFSHLWMARLETALSERERVTVGLPVREIRYRDEETALLDHMISDRVRYVCYDGKDAVRLHLVVPPPPPPPPPPPEPEPEPEPPRIALDDVRVVAVDTLDRWVAEELDPHVRELWDTSLRGDLLEDVAAEARTEVVRTVRERGVELMGPGLTGLVKDRIALDAPSLARAVLVREGPELLAADVATVAKATFEGEGAALVKRMASEFLTSAEGRTVVEKTAVEGVRGALRTADATSLEEAVELRAEAKVRALIEDRTFLENLAERLGGL